MKKKIFAFIIICVLIIGVSVASVLVDQKTTTLGGSNVKAKSEIATDYLSAYSETTGPESDVSRYVNSTFYYLNINTNTTSSTNKNKSVPKGTPQQCKVSHSTIYSYIKIYKVSASHTASNSSGTWNVTTYCYW